MIDYRTPLIEVPRPNDAIEIVRATVANALSCVGLSGAKPTREAFARLLAPIDSPGADQETVRRNAESRAAIMGILAKPFGSGGISTCGMTAEGIHARLRAQAGCLYQRYIWGSSVSRAEGYLRTMGAWQDARSLSDVSPRPGAGAYVIIGCRSQGEAIGGIEHAFIVVGWEDDVCISVDGGQVGADQLQCVKLVRRRLVLRGGRPWLVREDGDPRTAPGRRVYGWGDAERMLYRQDWPTMIVPEGWDDVEVAPAPPVAPVAYQLGTTRGVQAALAGLGYDVGPVDGVMGPRTRAAVMAYQRAVGLTADGVVGRMTRAALASALD